MHCPECGFVNSEGANYCQKCGAFLSDVQQESDDTTAAWQLDDTGDIQPVDPEVAAEEGTLVIRSGGGRSGETFTLAGDQIRIGLRRGVDIEVNWVGRLGVWPTMFSLFLAMVSVTWVAKALLYVGLAMTLAATAMYLRDGLAVLRRPSSSA